jgi:Replication protein.
MYAHFTAHDTLSEARLQIADVITDQRQKDRLLSCVHIHTRDPSTNRQRASYCGSYLCPQCIRMKAEAASRELLDRLHTMQSSTTTAHLGTFTIADCTTDELRPMYKTLTSGFRRLVDKVGNVIAGTCTAYEIVPSTVEPWKHHLHLHGALSMGSAYSGRNYLSTADWNSLWQESIGTIAGTVRVNKRPVDIIANYCLKHSPEYMLSQAADINRFIQQREELKGVASFRYSGTLK